MFAAIVNVLKAIPLALSLWERLVVLYEKRQLNQIERHYQNKLKSLEILEKLYRESENDEERKSLLRRISAIRK